MVTNASPYVPLIIDIFARKIVGWRASTSMTAGFVLDDLNQAIIQCAPSEADELIHLSDRGSQYLSIRHTERLAGAGIDTSVGSGGDSYDNVLTESIIGRFKTKVIKFLGPWKSVGQVEWVTLKWVDWYNNTRLHSAIGYMTPHEAMEAFNANLNAAEKSSLIIEAETLRTTESVQCAPTGGRSQGAGHSSLQGLPDVARPHRPPSSRGAHSPQKIKVQAHLLERAVGGPTRVVAVDAKRQRARRCARSVLDRFVANIR